MEWIKFSEEKPPLKTSFLAYGYVGYDWEINREKKMLQCYLKEQYGKIECEIECECSGNEFDRGEFSPTHWMPLPEEPKEE